LAPGKLASHQIVTFCICLTVNQLAEGLSPSWPASKIKFKEMYIPGVPIPPESDDDTIFVYHVGGGVGYIVSTKVTLDLKYRYLVGSDPEFGTTEAEFVSHNFYIGVRYTF
jgi:opacity protein-like surface antigen